MTHHISAIVELVYFAMRSRLQVWWDAIEIENHQIDKCSNLGITQKTFF
jgi:hypothetical protein